MENLRGDVHGYIEHSDHCMLLFLWMECYNMQAEWLLRDVLFIAEELPGPMQPDGEILTQAVSGGVVIVQGLYILPGCRIC